MQGPFIQSAAGRTILTAPMGTPAAPALILAPGSTLGGTLALELPSGVPAPTCVSPLTLTSALRIPDGDYAWRESEIYRADIATGRIDHPLQAEEAVHERA